MSSTPSNTSDKPNTRSRAKEQKELVSNEIPSTARPNTHKRKVTSTSPTTITPNAKKTTATMTASIDDIERLMERHIDKQTKSIKDEIKALGDELKSSFENQIVRINERIEGLQDQFQTQLADVRSDVNKCIEQLDLGEENNKRIALLNELKLNGIAHNNGENLNKIFLDVAQLVGFDTANPLHIPHLSRAFIKNRQNNESSMSPLIIMKFVAKHIRNSFYGLYLAKVSKQPILTEHINLPQGKRILIGEHLTPHNQAIFKEAIKLKRDKKLIRVNTFDGVVFVKANLSDKLTCIKTHRELDLFVANITTNDSEPNINSSQNNIRSTALSLVDKTVEQPQTLHQMDAPANSLQHQSSSNHSGSTHTPNPTNPNITTAIPMDINDQSGNN